MTGRPLQRLVRLAGAAENANYLCNAALPNPLRRHRNQLGSRQRAQPAVLPCKPNDPAQRRPQWPTEQQKQLPTGRPLQRLVRLVGADENANHLHNAALR